MLAEEQAALRRVATLVARGAAPEEVFAAVAKEVGRLFLVEEEVGQPFVANVVHMCRYNYDGTYTIVASEGGLVSVGERWPIGGNNCTTLVFETGRPARIDNYAVASGPGGVRSRERGIRSSTGTPILVEGRLWGVVGVATTLERPPPPDAEQRLASFTELVAMAIANTQARTELAASRARIVAAADETRRQIQRDLHDGAQQRQVHAVIGLKLALRALNNGDANASELVAEALRHAEQANSELRELAHGILPAALVHDGLRGGLQALVSRIPLPVSVEISVERLPAEVEATAYFIVTEALTNVLKHAHAERAMVSVQAEDGLLRMEVRDDGIGGADPERGSGLIGVSDRAQALGGTLQLTSSTGRGTTLLIQVPVEGHTSSAVAAPAVESAPPVRRPQPEQAEHAQTAGSAPRRPQPADIDPRHGHQ